MTKVQTLQHIHFSLSLEVAGIIRCNRSKSDYIYNKYYKDRYINSIKADKEDVNKYFDSLKAKLKASDMFKSLRINIDNIQINFDRGRGEKVWRKPTKYKLQLSGKIDPDSPTFNGRNVRRYIVEKEDIKLGNLIERKLRDLIISNIKEAGDNIPPTALYSRISSKEFSFSAIENC